MRRLASDILNELEKRVAELEKEASTGTGLETLKKLLQIPLGKERVKTDGKNFYFSRLREGKVAEADMEVTPNWDNDHIGKVVSKINFRIGAVYTADRLDLSKMKSELEKEVKKLLSNSSLLKDAAREEMNKEERENFTELYYDSRYYGFSSWAKPSPVQISIEMGTHKSQNVKKVTAVILVTQDFKIDEKGEYGD